MEEQRNAEIQRGFNAGYLLEKLNPKLSKKLLSGVKDKKDAFMLGFAKGAEQYNQESFFDSPPPNIPDNVQDLNLDKTHNQEMDKSIGGEGFEP